ncbi:MAG: membrane dipeptidase [Bacillales bacterium]|nr:membrane dipeptidase [Bacillales bacterium]
MKLPPIFISLADLFEKNGFDLYMVGGTTRDFLLGKELVDFDFATNATIDEMKCFMEISENFKSIGSMTCKYQGSKIDITTLRKEKEYIDYRHPSIVEFVNDPEIDSERRDLTINALYLDNKGNLYDFHGGLNDLHNHIIKMINDPLVRFNEDPLRLLRVIRFSLILDFVIEDSLEQIIKENVGLLKKINYIKSREEIDKMMKYNENKARNLLRKYHVDQVLPIVLNSKNPLNIIDLHCDTLTRNLKDDENFLNSNLHIDLNKLYKGEYLLQCFAVFIYLKEGESSFKKANEYIDKFDYLMSEYSHLISPIRSYKELIDNKSKGKLSALLSLEEGEILEGNIDNIDYFYSRGVRMMTLTWNFENSLAYPNDVMHNQIQNGGLKELGIKAIKRMNELGIIIDVSHLNDDGFYDVIKYSTKPIVASHSNAREVQNRVRNLTDDMILLLHKNKGVMGINYCPDFVSNNKGNQIKDLVKHIKHIKDLGCIDNIALGSDFDGIPTPNGLNDASKLPELINELKNAGFSTNEIDKITHKNFLRVLKNVCK